jgi:hypothetical protein
MLKECSHCSKEKEYPEEFKRGGKRPLGGYYYRNFCIICDRKKQNIYRLEKGLTKNPRGTPRENLKGRTFGQLEVVSHSGYKKQKSGVSKGVWLCKCLCGVEKEILESNLKNGHTNSCGCSNRRKGKNNPKYKGCEDLSLRTFNVIKYNAKRRNLEFTITIEYIWKLFIEQNKKCKLTQKDIYLYASVRDLENQTASLDRIDNSMGYIKGNVQWVHKDVNMMKRTYDQDYFIELCKLIAENN